MLGGWPGVSGGTGEGWPGSCGRGAGGDGVVGGSLGSGCCCISKARTPSIAVGCRRPALPNASRLL